jgi:hypothetical protein
MAITENTKFILTVSCNPRRDNWQACLFVETDQGHSVVARYEQHGGHPGLHGHGHCDRGGLEVGATSMDNLVRFPKPREHHRRLNAWTDNTFWESARRFFRITEDNGPLWNRKP